MVKIGWFDALTGSVFTDDVSLRVEDEKALIGEDVNDEHCLSLSGSYAPLIGFFLA